MKEISAHEANIVVLTIMIQLLERQEFSSSEIGEKAQRDLRKAKNRQLEVLQSNLTFAKRQVR